MGAVSLSYGHRLYKDSDRQLAAGGTFRYLKGFGYEEIAEADGRVVTLEAALMESEIWLRDLPPAAPDMPSTLARRFR